MSTINPIKTKDKGVRGKRSKIVGAWCSLCNDYHELNIKNWVRDNEMGAVCKKSIERLNKLMK